MSDGDLPYKSPIPGTPENHYDDSVDESVVVDERSIADASTANQMPEPTTNSMNDSDSFLAKGISSILSTVIRDFDSRADDTGRSQDQICFAIDRLTRELDQLLEDAPLPFIMQHAAKISGVRKRVSSLNSILKSIQRRVDNIDRMLSVGLPHEKTTTESAGQH